MPENRKEQGLVLQMTCRDSIPLPQGPGLAIKTPDWRQPASVLSGGQQQEIVIGKRLSMQPRALIVGAPIRGINLGSKSEINALRRALAAQGCAMLVISSEIPEEPRVSDRIMCVFTIDEVTEDSLM